MKTRMIMVMAVLLAMTGRAQRGRAMIPALMHEQQQSWNAGDIPGFMKHYWHNDSLKFVGSRGITYGWQQTLDNYVRSYPDRNAMGKLTFRLFEVTQLARDAVYVIGSWSLEKDKPVGGYFTLLWRRIQGKWVIVADHTS